MTIPAPPTQTDPSTPPTRTDPATFAARGDAFLAWFPTGWTNLRDSLTWIAARAQEVFDWAASATASEANALASKNAAATSASNAAGSASASAGSAAAALVSNNSAATSTAAATAAAVAAQGFASIAQAVSPDSPMRINTSRVSADFTLAPGYNAASAGQIEIAENITVTISDTATWSIV
jgi:hypothetical protein